MIRTELVRFVHSTVNYGCLQMGSCAGHGLSVRWFCEERHCRMAGHLTPDGGQAIPTVTP